MIVGCVVPCYREQIERVQRTTASILAVEGIDRVVIVDDGGNDPALLALASTDPRIAVVALATNEGPSAAMNAGVAALPPDAIVCRLDVGDEFYPAIKARQIARARTSRRPSFSAHFDPVEHRVFRPPHDWARRIYHDGTFCICTMVLTRHDFDAVGGFDESLRYGDDWDFTMKIQHHVGWEQFDEATCSAGVFDGGHTKTAAIDPEKRARRAADNRIIIKRGHRMSHGGADADALRARARSRRP